MSQFVIKRNTIYYKNVEKGVPAHPHMSYTLNNLRIEKSAKISKLNCNDKMRRRLQDLGIVRGAKITAKLASPSGGLIAYEIKGSLLALRDTDSSLIDIELL